MDSNQDSPPNVAKVQKSKWNIFQRGAKTKSETSLNTLADSDSVELQRVSFAASINDLPERPSAFKQVLGQIGALKSIPKGGLKMKRVQSFKRNGKDGRSNSPQGRLSVGSASAVNLDNVGHGRPRSSSNSSFNGALPNFKLSTQLVAEDQASANTNDRTSAADNRSSTGSTHSATLPAGLLLTETIIQPSAAPVLGAENHLNASLASYDTVDGSPGPDHQRNRNSVELEHVQQKILRISEAIKLEQVTRDDNVAEYLKLSENADKQQAGRIKTVFEKKNQKSSATISQLQKKLDSYHRRLRELESNSGGRQSRLGLRDVGANLADSVRQVSKATQNAAGAIVAKPKDIAYKLKNKFGSADNLSTMRYDDDPNDEFVRYGSADDVSSTSESIEMAGGASNALGHDDLGQPLFGAVPESPTSAASRKIAQQEEVNALARDLLSVQAELTATQRTHNQLQSEWELWKNHARDETSSLLSSALQEERFRYDRLEEQFNDLTELHQHEVTMLKQELTSMEEKVEYHARERARDVEEAIENCQTRLAKMELQQQQLVSVEGLENANARALLGKLINLLLSVLAVVLVFVSTISGLITPLMRSPARMLSTLAAIIAFLVAYKNWTLFANWYFEAAR